MYSALDVAHAPYCCCRSQTRATGTQREFHPRFMRKDTSAVVSCLMHAPCAVLCSCSLHISRLVCTAACGASMFIVAIMSFISIAEWQQTVCHLHSGYVIHMPLHGACIHTLTKCAWHACNMISCYPSQPPPPPTTAAAARQHMAQGAAALRGRTCAHGTVELTQLISELEESIAGQADGTWHSLLS